MSQQDFLKKIYKILSFALQTNDQDIIRSSLESILEMLEDQINKK